jgi:3-hydroxybutyryl-CoA dehydratase
MNQVKIGTIVEFKKKFSHEDVVDFSRITGDDNPIHLDELVAQKSIFKSRVVHGMLVSSMFSKIFGTIYPGVGSIYLDQSLKFLKPVYINQEIQARVTLISFDSVKRKGTFLTECLDENMNLIITGEAKILFPKQTLNEE